MEIKNIVVAVLLCFFLVVITLLVVLLVRRRKSKKKLRCMTEQEKIQQVNELVEPLGFSFQKRQDIFSSRLDAWQQKLGYEKLYDELAVNGSMVIDLWPVYFEHKGRTWLIECWKGQYGINIGGEVGIYHADEIVPEVQYGNTHFEAVEDEELLQIRCKLLCEKEVLYEVQDRHWWLTGFKMGCFAQPEQLKMFVTISFGERSMAEAFYYGSKKYARKGNTSNICRNQVTLCMRNGAQDGLLRRWHKKLVQDRNRILVRGFRILTFPFKTTEERLLFLYYQVPWCLRHMTCLGRKRYLVRKKKHGML